MQKQLIEFDNVNEIVEIVESRFANANVNFIESMRDSLIVELQNFNSLQFDFDALHDVIECNLRACVAMNHAQSFIDENDDEFKNVVAIVDENSFHVFAIVALNVETRNAIIIEMINVNDDLSITKFTQ
jgi:hypothetical protein